MVLQVECTAQIALRDGRSAIVRPLRASDIEPLTAYFEGLSEETKGCYGPHPFDRATAEKLCASINHAETVRFVAVLGDDTSTPEFIGYMILTRQMWPDDIVRYGEHLLQGQSACFAPSVADAYQNQGVGIQMARCVMASARTMGLQQVILMGGVLARNERAHHFYYKLGFVDVGEFRTGQQGEILNYAMVLNFTD